MAIETKGKNILADFFDEGAYTAYFSSKESAVTVAFGCAGGEPVYAVCQNGGAVSAQDNANAVKFIKMAAKTGNPIVTFYNCAGAKLEDGLAALTSSAALANASAELSGVVPQIAVVIGVCAGSMAMVAASADVCIMSKDAELFLTAPFTAKAAGDKCENAGSAEYAAKAGVAQIVTKTAKDAAKKAAELVGILPSNNLSSPAMLSFEAPTAKINLAKYSAEQAAQSVLDVDSILELGADYGTDVLCALGTVAGNAVGVVATKGADSSICRSCTDKIARFVRLCDAFSIPVLTLVNTNGFVKSVSCEQAGGLRAASRLAGTYADATTAKVTVFTGKAVGTAYIAFASADTMIAFEGCTIAPIEPAAAATILNKKELDAGSNITADTAKFAKAYISEVCSADAAVKAGVADIIADGASLRGAVISALDMLSTKRTQRLPKKHGNMAL